MNQPQPAIPPRKPARTVLFVWAVLASVAALVFALAAGFFFLRPKTPEVVNYALGLVNDALGRKSDIQAGESPGDGKDYSQSNSVTILLGEKESGGGLRHISSAQDGLTTIQTMAGARCRYLRLKPPHNRTTLNFYFAIDYSFKQGDVRTVAIEIEYFDPQPGMVGIHYDALNAPGKANPVYQDAIHPVRLAGSHTWKKATFHARNASFGNLQNSGADFRIWAKAPELYIRRVTVTRETQQDTRPTR